MAAFDTKIFTGGSCGAGMMDVLLAMAVIAIAAPFAYNQIASTNHDIQDMATAKKIIALRAPVLNFVRLNQDKWPDVAQIKLDEEELAQISPDASAGFIDKYAVVGATITDVYLAFPPATTDLRQANVAKHIGGDAAIVGADGIAYGNAWAVVAPDFKQGDLIYRITRDLSGEDKSKYLHRGTSGEDDLNVMMRDLNMGGYNVYGVGTMLAESAQVKSANALFLESDDVMADTIYFSDGASMDGGNVSIGAMRVTGDISGFRNIYADKLNGTGYTTTGRVIADRATVSNSVNVARDLVIKSDTTRTISGFVGITANSVLTPFISAEEMVFYENFGLTISGELLMSTTAPLKIGSWTFPSTTPPRFTFLQFERAGIPDMPTKNEFGVLMSSGWQEYIPETLK